MRVKRSLLLEAAEIKVLLALCHLPMIGVYNMYEIYIYIYIIKSKYV